EEGTAAEAPTVEASRAERPRAVKARGKLVVFATPYATVFLNGRKLGEVQGRATYSLPAGSYRLTFKHPSLPEGESRDVTLPPEGTVTQRFQLRRR
ncbi:MAG TPA: serine/threonine protein kinase, partial [Myxococcaceae bacterium]|nr:serine/threonine protein kinase [Myxococcaceae bacterium]